MWAIFGSFFYTGLLVWAFPQSHKLNLTCAWNLPCYLHFGFCLFVWLIQLKRAPHLSHHEDCFRVSYVILRDLGTYIRVGRNLKGETSYLSSYHATAKVSTLHSTFFKNMVKAICICQFKVKLITLLEITKCHTYYFLLMIFAKVALMKFRRK